MNRRDVLKVGGAAAVPVVSVGGAVLLQTGPLSDCDEGHHITVLNAAKERHTFDVTVENDAGDVLFQRTYDLGGRRGDENRVVCGDPAVVTAVIDGEYEKRFAWEPPPRFYDRRPDGCSSATTTSLQIELRGESVSDDVDENRDGDDFWRIFECSTATDE